MLPPNQNFPIISSQILSNIKYNEIKNNTERNSINDKIMPNTKYTNNTTNKDQDSFQKMIPIDNYNFHKRIDSPFLLKGKKPISSEKIKVEINKPQKENKNPKKKLIKKKSIEKCRIYIQQLQNYIKIKEEEIKSLKKELQNKSKNIKKNFFENLDTGGMGLNILSSKQQNNEKIKNIKRIYKIQFLDKMEILSINKNININIEKRDSIEILPTIKTFLKAQKVNEMIINPFKKKNYIQILDQLAIYKNNKIKYLKIEDRDSIEILPTLKTPLQAQKVNQMFIERLEIPDFLIQNLDNMVIMKGNKIINMIESRDSIKITEEKITEKTPLQAQHIENMIIDSFESENIQISESKDFLKTPRNKNFQKIRNSIEHVPLKKSPLQLKTAEDLKNKYLKKYKSENKEFNNKNIIEKEGFKIDYIESINVCNITFKPKSNYKNYNYDKSFIKPSLKMQNKEKISKIINNRNNHKIEEISYKNKDIKYNLATPKPSILPLSKTTKNINKPKNESKKDKNNNNKKGDNNNNYYRKINLFENNKNNNNGCGIKKGRNVRVIRTQKYGPSIIEKRFVAHSCEKCNENLHFKVNDSIKDNFHAIHSIKQK